MYVVIIICIVFVFAAIHLSHLRYKSGSFIYTPCKESMWVACLVRLLVWPLCWKEPRLVEWLKPSLLILYKWKWVSESSSELNGYHIFSFIVHGNNKSYAGRIKFLYTGGTIRFLPAFCQHCARTDCWCQDIGYSWDQIHVHKCRRYGISSTDKKLAHRC